MNVRVCIQFEPVTADDWRAMRSLANGLTNDRDSVQVFADPQQADCLVAEFTMPTETQYHAVDKIDRELRFGVENRVDSSIAFPRSEGEIARVKRKAERRKAKPKEG